MLMSSSNRAALKLINRSMSQATRTANLLDELYTAVRAQRFEDIVVIQTKLVDPKYIILGSAFSSRHLVSGTEVVNKLYKNSIKTADQEFARLSISSDWNVLDFRSIVIHLFSKDTRNHFDIEQLWTCGEKYDDLTNFPQHYDPITTASMFLNFTNTPEDNTGSDEAERSTNTQ